MEKCTRRRKNRKVARNVEKAAIKLMNRTKKAGYLLKHTAGAVEEGKGSIYSSEKAAGPPPSNFRHTARAVINFPSAIREETRNNVARSAGFREVELIQTRRDTLGRALRPQLPGTRRV